MSSDLKIDGFVARGFEAVRDAFATDPRGGSALTILRAGEPVVDLREGWQDAARTRPWGPQTLVNVYSVGKPVIALAVLRLAERGLLSLDDRVPRLWPQFKTDASVREILAHTAGLPVFPVVRDALAWPDWDLLCADLAAATPEWPPGTAAGEHALTYGHLLGELVRRVDGRPPAQFVAEEIAGPYGLDFGYGMPARRCAEVEFESPDWADPGEPGSLHARAVSNPAGARDLAVVNSDLWRSATIPAVNLHATAAAIAGFYTIPGVEKLAVKQFAGYDAFLGQDVVWGLGVQIETDGTWGMGGLGGNAGWYDPNRNLAIGYCTRRLGGFATADRIEAALNS